jgi:hypothetical protein
MFMRISSFAAVVFLAFFSAHSRSGENSEASTSFVLKELVRPLSDKSGYMISINKDTLAIRGMAVDPSAYLRAISGIPIFKNPQMTGSSVTEGQSNAEQSFGLTAEIIGRPANGSHGTDTQSGSASDVSSAAKTIFAKRSCTLVSEVEIPEKGAKFRWRCPMDLLGVANVVSELETALNGIWVEDLAVYESSILKEDQKSMDMRFDAIAR